MAKEVKKFVDMEEVANADRLTDDQGEFVSDVSVNWRYGMRRPRRRVVANRFYVDKNGDVTDVSLTRQEFKDECDINNLLRKYTEQGIPPALRVGTPQYFDATDVPDFQTAMQVVIDAQEAFMKLPAAVRKELDNDPARFVEYAQDPENLPNMRKWGLAPPEKVPDAPMRVEVVNPPPGDEKGSTQ